MKKILSLLALAMMCITGANAQEDVYTVAGNSIAIFGAEWSSEAEANDMVKGDDDVYTKTYEGVELTNGFKLEYKIVKNHSWNESWGKDGGETNADYTVWEGNGKYDVTFTFNPATSTPSCAMTKIISDHIENAEFDPDKANCWTPVISGQYREVGMGLIGEYKVYGDNAATVDEKHLATEYCAGFECRWSTNYAAYTQEVALPAGAYSLNFDVENVNASTTKAAYENRFTVKYGETVVTDESTEWMNGKSAWTNHSIKFILEEDAIVTFSLGYGTGSNNIGSANTPILYVSHLDLGTFDPQAELNQAIADLQDVIDAAKALKNEYRTSGLDEFNDAIADAEAALTSTTIEAVKNAIDALKTAMTDFRKINGFTDFEAGYYYVINAVTGQKMAAGHDWGTRGIVNEIGLDLYLTPYADAHSVTFDSRVSNGGNSHFLGSNLYMDSSEWGWFFENQGYGFFYISNGEQYINLDADNNLVLSDTPCEWIIVSKEGVIAEKLEEMAEATPENPVDATMFISGANFNRNDARNSAWKITATNSKLSDGNNVNNCAESYHSTNGFTFSQAINGLPAGIYQLKAQGFYRQDNEAQEAAPVFFIGNQTAEVPARTGEENSMSTASESFTNGLYTIEPIEVKYYGVGDLTIGVKTESSNQWVIFDNFQLTYCGPFEIESYTVAGAFKPAGEETPEEASFFGEAWTPTIEANDLVKGADGIYTKTFENVQLNAGTIYYKVVADRSWDAPSWGFGDNNADYVVNEAGTYNITFTFNPDNLLENGYNVACAVVKAEEVDPIELCAITPAPGYYDALPTEWVITYGGKKLSVKEDAEVILTYQDGETEFPLYIMLDENDDTKVIVSFDGRSITTAGEWTINIPENTISIEGTPIADPQSFKYVVNNPEDYTIDPAPGTYSSLKDFTITFNNYMIELNEEEAAAILFNTETEEEVNATVTEIAGKKLYISLDEEVTTDGIYQLILMDASVKNLATDKFIPELAFDYIISTATGINGVAAETQMGVVFNLNGQRVMKAQKGLYIINGKKQVVK